MINEIVDSIKRTIDRGQRSRSITYFILLDESSGYFVDDKGFSLFQGFSAGILRAAKILKLISRLPACVEEFEMPRGLAIRNRTFGLLNREVIPIVDRYFVNTNSLVGSNNCICVFYYISQKKYVEEFQVLLKRPIVKICIDNTDEGDIYIGNLTRNNLYKVLKKKRIITGRVRYIKWNKKNIGLDSLGHMVFEPDIDALSQFEFKGNIKEYYTSADDHDFVLNICRYVDKIQELRKKHGASYSFGPSLVVGAPSLYRWHYQQARTKTNKETFGAKKCFDYLKRQQGYTLPVDVSGFSSDLLQVMTSMLQIRRLEVEAFTAGVSLLACNYFAPFIRFPYGVNSINYDLCRFAGCSRGGGIRRKYKLLKIQNDISCKIEKYVGHEFQRLISKSEGHVKILSDVPIEFLDINGLPMGISHDCSRYITSAGNSFLQQVMKPPVVMKKKILQNVLIVRSFKRDDPIRETLTDAISLVLKDQPEVKLIISDVSSKEDFIESVNSFDGGIMVYDGHGAYNKDEHLSILNINGVDVDIADLKGKIQVPPIVLLSACDTYPVDGSHMSSAHAFLPNFAHTVLATLTPVTAKYAARFIARLLLRVSDLYLNLVFSSNKIVPWSSIVTGLKRMEYATDFINSIFSIYRIKNERLRHGMGTYANVLINSYSECWMDSLKNKLAKEIGITVDNLNSEIIKLGIYSESMSYVQLGNPDTIMISE